MTTKSLRSPPLEAAGSVPFAHPAGAAVGPWGSAGPLAIMHLPCPLGTLTLVAGAAGLREIRFADDDDALATEANADAGRPAAILRGAADQLAAYFAGQRTLFDLPLDPLGTPFQRAAWDILRAIPYGTTISYAEQARRLGDPRKARAVGGANGRNPLPIVVPCHRVIGSGGALVGFAAGTGSKAWLLEHERAVAGRVRSH